MSGPTILALSLFLIQVESVEPAGEDIVVTAKRQKCNAQWRGKALSNSELDRQARNWAQGIPVRVRAPRRADYKCLAKIAFRLADRGVRRIEFIAPDD